jgi:dipeptidyl aminopeptidase/acylaminoacyl peptidase
MRIRACTPLVFSALIVIPFLASAQQATRAAQQQGAARAPRSPASLRLEQYLDWEDVQDPQLSPDGKQIIYGRRWVDKINDQWKTSLWIMSIDGTKNRFLLDGSDAKWSPDGTRIAYVTRGEPNGSQVFVRWMDAEGAVTQLTHLTENPSALEWSPDGKWLAFTMLVPERDDWKIAMPAAPKGAKWVESPRIVQKLNYRRDRQGYVEDGSTHIFVLSADGGGTPRQVTTGNFNDGAFRWMPDGKRIVFSGLREADAEYAWRESEIYSVDVATGAVAQLTHRKGPDGQPTPSPDGKLIAYTGFDSTSDTWVDSKLYVMNADGSNSHVISGTLDRSPQGLMWAKDGGAVYFNAENEGSRNLYVATLKGDVHPVTKGDQVLTVTDIDARGLAVGVASTAAKPNDVVDFDLKQPAATHQLTSVNDDVLFGKKIGAQDEIWVSTRDGMKVQGWVVKPPDFDPAKKYPLILEIHGGPHSMYNVAFNFARQQQAADGYVVLYTNPRGSTGYGSAFGNAIKNAYPGKDFDDLMAAVDTVIGRGYVDANNMFVYGCSGGGVLTAWTVGHTNRFAAAASLCPVIDWVSFVGITDGASWYYNFAKLPWEDPSEHLKRSPLMYVGNVTTPTLLMTGVNDLRTPISQTEEFYRALKLRKVPTAMIRFNDEWHGTSSRPSNYLRTQLYLESWFDRYSRKNGARVADQ